MELHQLEAFETLIQRRSFTRAAEALHLTQPAVTRQIAGLEAELHTRLFDRLGRTVQPTTAGEALHRYAEPILRVLSEARQAVADVRSGTGGRLTIGASSTLATYVLPPILREFRAANRAVDISVHTGVSAAVLAMVRAGEVDAGLVTADVSDPLLEVTVLAEYETCVVVPSGHPFDGRETVSVMELEGSSFILMESGTNLRSYVDRVLGAAGVDEQVMMELDNVEAIKRMIEAGLGISLLPRVAVNTEVDAGRLCALRLTDIAQPGRTIKVVRRRDRFEHQALKAMLALLQQASVTG
jgi:DNA-binding transcriptional LysR family regulator